METSNSDDRHAILHAERFHPSSVFVFHAKQRLYDRTYKSLWVPDLICGFVHT